MIASALDAMTDKHVRLITIQEANNIENLFECRGLKDRWCLEHQDVGLSEVAYAPNP
jgi:hypothetical protein